MRTTSSQSTKDNQTTAGTIAQLNETGSFSLTDILVLLSSFVMMLGASYMLYEFHSTFVEIRLNRLTSQWGIFALILSVFLFVIKVLFLTYLYRLYKQYKPVRSVRDKELPTCTVIVPAYNEGKLVWQTLMSLAESNYPSQKVQLLAIDDGSKDDTWLWMLKAKEVLGDRVSIFQQPENKGKRHALYRGFHLAKGDVIVTVDSDSIVDTNTLRNLVSPFVTNPECGAVAGNVRVLNKHNAIIPKMLSVSFAFSFEFVRSAQSVLGTVLCTPGALAGYRKEAVMACLPEWINQTFMGKPSDIGEDRAMTNMILKQGFQVLFQKNAPVYTNIPENYTTLRKMYLRWERSNVRENIMMSRFAFTNFRSGSKTGSRLLLLNQWVSIIMAYPMLFILFFFLAKNPVFVLSSMMTGIFVFSSIPALFYARKYSFLESIWAYSYSILYAFSLFWITPYAIVTAGKRGWLTRELS